MKTADLQGARLDYFVARAIGRDAYILKPVATSFGLKLTNIQEVCFAAVPGRVNWYAPFSPSTVWNDLGPLIESERIDLCSPIKGWWQSVTLINAAGDPWTPGGDTPLIAACRALVAREFGEEVPEVPHGS